jgi:glycosyltransferase involved in cell wall biosynthesis
MTLGTLLPFSRRLVDANPKFAMGKFVAHEELTSNLLRFNVVGGVDIFASSLLPNRFKSDQAACESGITEAFRDLMVRPRFRALPELPILVEQPNYAFLSSGPESHRLGQIRWALAPTTFNIHTLIHSVNWFDLLPSYLGLIISYAPQDTVIVTSRAARDAFSTLLSWAQEFLNNPRTPEIVHIPLGCEVRDDLGEDRQAARRFLGLQADDHILLYVGRLSEEYKADLEPLLLTAKRLLRDFPLLRLVIAGYTDGSYAGRFRDIARQIQFAERLLCFENPPDAIKRLLYSSADIFVSPVDNIQESFGLSLLEAMTHRLPVVASDWSGYRDIVLDNQTGYLVPTFWDSRAGQVADMFVPLETGYGVHHYLAHHTIVDVELLHLRLDSLLRSSELRIEMGVAGRRRVEEVFSWKKIAAQYNELFSRNLRHDLRSPLPCPRPIPLSEAFQNYAALLMTETMRVCTTDYGSELANRSNSENALPSQSLTMSLLRKCSGRSVSLGELVGDDLHHAWSRAVHLAKIGALRLCE